MDPRDAAGITAFLDRHHEQYTLETEGRSMIIRVTPDRAKLLKEYLSAPVDSARFVHLVRSCRLSEKDSARVRRESPPAAQKFLLPRDDRPDSIRIGEAFDAVFEKGNWKTLRTREYEIVVEFTGTVKNRALDESFGTKVMEELTDHRGYLIAEAGTPGAVWNFRWRIGIEGKSFVKESIQVTLGGKREGKKQEAGEVLHIDL